MSTLQEEASINYTQPIIHIKKLNDGKMVVADNQTTIRIIDPNSLKTLNGFKAKIIHNDFKVESLDFSKDGQYFGSTSSDDKETRLYSIKTRKVIGKVTRHQGKVSAIKIDPYNRYLLSCGEDGKTFALDIKNRKLAFTLPPRADTITDIAFSKSGQWLATAGYDKKIFIFDLNLMRISNEIKTSTPVTKVHFLGKNKLISYDKNSDAIIWDFQNAKVYKRLPKIHDEVLRMVTAGNGQFLFMGTILGYIIVFDLQKYEMISQNYIKIDSAITSLYCDESDNTLYIGTKNGDIYKYYIYEGIETVKQLINNKEFGDVEEYIKINPLLKYTSLYNIMEQIWEKSFTNARILLEKGKVLEAESILETFKKIPSKNTLIQKLLKDYKEYKTFYDLARGNKIHLAYSFAERFPLFKESTLYKQMEKRWTEKFKQAQKLALDQRNIDQAKEILKPYNLIPEKSKYIQEMLLESSIYNRFKMALTNHDFHQLYAYIDKYPFLKQFPEYQQMIQHAKKIFNKGVEYAQKGEYNQALKYLRMACEFKEFEEESKEILHDIQTRNKFYEALKNDDLSSAYLYLSKNEELLDTPDGKKLEMHWNKIVEQANRFAAKGEIEGVKKALGDFVKYPSKYTAIASIFSYAYMVQLEQAIKDKQERISIERGIKNYVAYFGVNEQIKAFEKIFKKHYPASKLNLEYLNAGSLTIWRPHMILSSILN
ncbi:MAG: hypothetical protein GXO11_08120 [Epsilonproteobacteria bacterium]|nr:hypothetical protein [Campylobacterota bacterium]